MMMRVAFRNVVRHRLRTTFTVLALSMAVALLADMLMLSRGMEKTFYRVLSSVGYEVRVCPRGTLPFTTDAVIEESHRVSEALAQDARVERTLCVLGTTLHVDTIPVFALGVEGEQQSLYRVVEGRDIVSEGDILLNRNAVAAFHATIGDTLQLTRDAPGATLAFSRARTMRVVGMIELPFDLPGQRTAIMPLATAQEMRDQPDVVSFVLVKLRGHTEGALTSPEEQRAVATSIARQFSDLSVYSMDSLMSALERQLAYFKQFALILSTISLLVTFLLVAVVLIIGVGERRGEIAALRSLGFRRRSIQAMILSESALLLAMSAVFGSVLGWFLAGYLDHILTRSPSLPEGYRFFIPAWREILTAVALSGIAGIIAALLPALQAARVDMAKTLHEEVV
jgi:putative ABC transport system permease protein